MANIISGDEVVNGTAEADIIQSIGGDGGSTLIGGDGDDVIIGDGAGLVTDPGAGNAFASTAIALDNPDFWLPDGVGEPTLTIRATGVDERDVFSIQLAAGDQIALKFSAFAFAYEQQGFPAPDAFYYIYFDLVAPSGESVLSDLLTPDPGSFIASEAGTYTLYVSMYEQQFTFPGGITFFGKVLEGARYGLEVEVVDHPASGVIGNDVLSGGPGDDDLQGGGGRDLLDGGAAADRLDGGVGDDILRGGAGDDRLIGGGGVDEYDGGGGADTADFSKAVGPIVMTAGAAGRTNVTVGGAAAGTLLNIETIIGGAVADRLLGSEADDTLDGGLGKDQLDGGAGLDVASYQGRTLGGVAVSLNDSGATVVLVAGIAEDVLRNIEGVIGTGGADRLIGSGAANILSGADGDDVIAGRGGADVLSGGAQGDAGRDTVDYSEKTAPVTVSLGLADVFVDGVVEDRISGFEAVYGGAAADQLTGDDRNNLIRGGPGADVLDGSQGIDTLDLSDRAAVVLDLRAGQVSTVFVGGVAEDQVAGFEVVLGGAGRDVLSSDVVLVDLRGGAGDDVLSGRANFSRLNGGAGLDIADYSAETTALRIGFFDGSFNFESGRVQRDGTTSPTLGFLIGIEAVHGGQAADRFIGNAEGNIFRGGGGADVIDGRAGVDTIDFGDKAAAVVLTLNGDRDELATVGGAAEDVVRNVENVIGGFGADILGGDAGVNRLQGEGGNDTLVGGAGKDFLLGGGGFDFADYRDRALAVVLTLNGAGPSAAIVGGIAEDQLRDIEGIYGGALADRLTGDGAANLFRGGGGADVLDGGGGLDSVDFRDKTDAVVLTLKGAAEAVATVGGVAEDRVRNVENVQGGAGADKLTGDAGANIFVGNEGADFLRGAGGADTLAGGLGADVFFVSALAESTVALAGRDTILDFSRVEGDRIHLAGIDADTGLAGDQAFTLGALGVAGRLSVTQTAPGAWLVEGDVDGGGADFAILVRGAAPTDAAAFVL